MKGVGVVKESCPGGEIPSTFPSRKTWKQFKKKKENTGGNATAEKTWRQGAIFFLGGAATQPRAVLPKYSLFRCPSQ